MYRPEEQLSQIGHVMIETTGAIERKRILTNSVHFLKKSVIFFFYYN